MMKKTSKREIFTKIFGYSIYFVAMAILTGVSIAVTDDPSTDVAIVVFGFMLTIASSNLIKKGRKREFVYRFARFTRNYMVFFVIAMMLAVVVCWIGHEVAKNVPDVLLLRWTVFNSKSWIVLWNEVIKIAFTLGGFTTMFVLVSYFKMRNRAGWARSVGMRALPCNKQVASLALVIVLGVQLYFSLSGFFGSNPDYIQEFRWWSTRQSSVSGDPAIGSDLILSFYSQSDEGGNGVIKFSYNGSVFYTIRQEIQASAVNEIKFRLLPEHGFQVGELHVDVKVMRQFLGIIWEEDVHSENINITMAATVITATAELTPYRGGADGFELAIKGKVATEGGYSIPDLIGQVEYLARNASNPEFISMGVEDRVIADMEGWFDHAVLFQQPDINFPFYARISYSGDDVNFLGKEKTIIINEDDLTQEYEAVPWNTSYTSGFEFQNSTNISSNDGLHFFYDFGTGENQTGPDAAWFTYNQDSESGTTYTGVDENSLWAGGYNKYLGCGEDKISGHFISQLIPYQNFNSSQAKLTIGYYSSINIEGDPDFEVSNEETYGLKVQLLNVTAGVLNEWELSNNWNVEYRSVDLDITQWAQDPNIFFIKILIDIKRGSTVGLFEPRDSLFLHISHVGLSFNCSPAYIGAFSLIDHFSGFNAIERDKKGQCEIAFEPSDAAWYTNLPGDQTSLEYPSSVYSPLDDDGAYYGVASNWDLALPVNTTNTFGINGKDTGWDIGQIGEATSFFNYSSVDHASSSWCESGDYLKLRLESEQPWTIGARYAAAGCEAIVPSDPTRQLSQVLLDLDLDIIEDDGCLDFGEEFEFKVYIQTGSSMDLAYNSSDLGSFNPSIDITSLVNTDEVFYIILSLFSNDWWGWHEIIVKIHSLEIKAKFVASSCDFIAFTTSSGIHSSIPVVQNPASVSRYTTSLPSNWDFGFNGSQVYFIGGTIQLDQVVKGEKSDGDALVNLKAAFLDGNGTTLLTVPLVSDQYSGLSSYPLNVDITSIAGLGATTVIFTATMQVPREGAGTSVDSEDVYRMAIVDLSLNGTSMMDDENDWDFAALTADGSANVAFDENSLSILEITAEGSNGANGLPVTFECDVFTPTLVKSTIRDTITNAELKIDYSAYLDAEPGTNLENASTSIDLTLQVHGISGSVYLLFAEIPITTITLNVNTSGTGGIITFPLSDCFTGRWYNGILISQFLVSVNVSVTQDFPVAGVDQKLAISRFLLTITDEPPEITWLLPYGDDMSLAGTTMIGAKTQLDSRAAIFEFKHANSDENWTHIDTVFSDTGCFYADFNTLNYTNLSSQDLIDMRVWINDSKGSWGCMEIEDIEIDNIVPEVSILNLQDNMVLGNPIFVDVNTTGHDDVHRVRYMLYGPNNETYELCDDPSGLDGFSFTWNPQFNPGEEGTFNLTAFAYDENDLVGTDTIVNIQIEMLDVYITSPVIGLNYTGQFSIQARSNSDLTENGSAWFYNPSSTSWECLGALSLNDTDLWVLNADLSQFYNTTGEFIEFLVEFTIDGGYSENNSVTVFVDTVTPDFILEYVEQPAAGVFEGVSAINLTMIGDNLYDLRSLKFSVLYPSDDEFITIESIPYPGASWDKSLNVQPLVDGFYTWKLTATDYGGHVVEATNDCWLNNNPFMFEIYQPYNDSHWAYDANQSTAVVNVTLVSADLDANVSSFKSYYKHVLDGNWTEFTPASGITEIARGHYRFQWSIDTASIDNLSIYEIKVTGSDIWDSVPFASTTTFTLDPFGGDEVAPSIDSVNQPLKGVTHGGSIVIDVNASDDVNGSGIMFVEIWANETGTLGDFTQDGSLLSRLDYNASNNYAFETKDAPFVLVNGSEIILRIVDRAWNCIEESYTVEVVLLSIDIESGSRVPTTGAERGLYRTLAASDDYITQVEFSLYCDVNGSLVLNSTSIDNSSSDGFTSNFTSVESGEYAMQCTITQVIGSTAYTYPWFDGLNGRTSPVAFTVDNDVPRDIVLGLENNSIVSGIISFNFTFMDDDPDLSHALLVDGIPLSTMTGYASGNTFTWDSTWTAQGWRDIVLSCTDSSNNTGYSAPFRVLVDNHAPAIPSGGISYEPWSCEFDAVLTDDVLNFSIQASEDLTNITLVSLYANDTLLWNQSTSNDSIDISGSISLLNITGLDSGFYSLRAVITSLGGTRKSTSTLLIYDRVAPVGNMHVPEALDMDGSINIYISASDNHAIKQVDVYRGHPDANGSEYIGIAAFDPSLNNWSIEYSYTTAMTADFFARIHDHLGNSVLVNVTGIELLDIAQISSNLSSGLIMGTPECTNGTISNINDYQSFIDELQVSMYYKPFNETGDAYNVLVGQSVAIPTNGTGYWEINWDTSDLVQNSSAFYIPMHVGNLESPLATHCLQGVFNDSGGIFRVDQDDETNYLMIYYLDRVQSGTNCFNLYNTYYDPISEYFFDALASDVDGDGRDELVLLSSIHVLLIDYNFSIDSFDVHLQGLTTINSSFSNPSMIEFNSTSGDLLLVVNQTIHALSFDITTRTFEQVIGSEADIGSDIVSIDYCGDALFFATKHAIGYMASNGSIFTIDQDINEVTMMACGNVDSDADMELVVGIETTGLAQSILVCYDPGSGGWLPYVITREDVLAKYSSFEIGYSLPQNQHGDIIIADDINGISNYQLDGDFEQVTVTPELHNPKGYQAVQDGLISSTILYPVQGLPASDYSLYEKYNDLAGYSESSSDAPIAANGTLTTRYFEEEPYWEVVTYLNQSDSAVDSQSPLGFAQFGEHNYVSWSVHRRQFLGSGAVPVNFTTGDPFNTSISTGKGISSYTSSFPFNFTSPLDDQELLVDGNMSTGSNDSRIVNSSSDTFYPINRYTPIWSGNYSSSTTIGNVNLGSGIEGINLVEGVPWGNVYVGDSDWSEVDDEAAPPGWEQGNVFTAYRDSLGEVAVTFRLDIGDRLNVTEDVSNDTPISLTINTFSVFKLVYDLVYTNMSRIPVKAGYYLTPVEVYCGSTLLGTAWPENSNIYGTVSNHSDERRLVWEQSESSYVGDPPPEKTDFEHLMNGVDLSLSLSKSQLLDIANQEITLKARPYFTSKPNSSYDDTYWYDPYWYNVSETYTPILMDFGSAIQFEVNELSYTGSYGRTFMFVEALYLDIGDDTKDSLTYNSGNFSLNISENALLQGGGALAVVDKLDEIEFNTVVDLTTDVAFGSNVNWTHRGRVYGMIPLDERYDVNPCENHTFLGFLHDVIDYYSYSRPFNISYEPTLQLQVYNYANEDWEDFSTTDQEFWGGGTVSSRFKIDPSSLASSAQDFVDTYTEYGGMLFRYKINNYIAITNVIGQVSGFNYKTPLYQYQSHNIFHVSQGIEFKELHVIAKASDGVWNQVKTSDHQIGLWFQSGVMWDNDFSSVDCDNVKQFYLEFDFLPRISWYSPTLDQAMYDYLGYKDIVHEGETLPSIFDGIRFTLGLELYNFANDSWYPFTCTSSDYGNQDITNVPQMLPYYMYKIKGYNDFDALQSSVRGACYLTTSTTANLSDFISYTEGFKSRYNLTFIWDDQSSYDAYNFNDWILPFGGEYSNISVKQTDFLLNDIDYSFKFYEHPKNVSITGISESSVNFTFTNTSQGASLSPLLDALANYNVIANLSMYNAPHEQFENFTINLTAYTLDQAGNPTLFPLVPEAGDPFFDYYVGDSIILNKSAFPVDSPCCLVPLPFPEDIPFDFDTVEDLTTRVYLTAELQEAWWDGWAPVPADSVLDLELSLEDASIEYIAGNINESNRGSLYKEFDFMYPASEIDPGQVIYLVAGFNSSLYVITWSKNLSSPTLIKTSQRELLGELGFLEANDAATLTYCQLYDWVNNAWVDTLCSITPGEHWSSLEQDITGTDLKFIYHPGLTAQHLPAGNFLDTGNNLIKARISMDYTSLLDANPSINGSAVIIETDGAYVDIYSNDGIGTQEVHAVEQEFLLDLSPPSGYSIEDIGNVVLDINAAPIVSFTTLLGEDITGDPDIEVISSSYSIVVGGDDGIEIEGTAMDYIHDLTKYINESCILSGKIINNVEIVNNNPLPVNVNISTQVTGITSEIYYAKFDSVPVAPVKGVQQVSIVDVDGASSNETGLYDVLFSNGMFGWNNQSSSSFNMMQLIHEVGNPNNAYGDPIYKTIVVDHGAPQPEFKMELDRLDENGTIHLTTYDELYFQVLQPHIDNVDIWFSIYNETTSSWSSWQYWQAPISNSGSVYWIDMYYDSSWLVDTMRVKFNATATDTINRTGTDSIEVLIDNLSPTVNITVDHSAPGQFVGSKLVSRESEFTVIASDGGASVAMVTVDIRINPWKDPIATFELVPQEALIGAPFKIDSSLWDESDQFLFIQVTAIDLSGNMMAQELEYLMVDDYVEIAVENASSYAYGDLLRGIMVDSFGLPVSSHEVEVFIDGKVFGTVKTDESGYFELMLDTIDVYSPEMFKNKHASVVTIETWQQYQGLKVEGCTSGEISLLSRWFSVGGEELKKPVINLDFQAMMASLVDPDSYEGMQLDLLIPSVSSVVYGSTTYSQIDVVFFNEHHQELRWSIGQSELLEYFDPSKHPESKTIVVDGKSLRLARVIIPFVTLKILAMAENFSITNYTSISIIGTDFPAWPGTIDPYNLPRQVLGIQGMRFIDLLNDHDLESENASYPLGGSGNEISFVLADDSENNQTVGISEDFESDLEDWSVDSYGISHYYHYPNGTTFLGPPGNGSAELTSALYHSGNQSLNLITDRNTHTWATKDITDVAFTTPASFSVALYFPDDGFFDDKINYRHHDLSPDFTAFAYCGLEGPDGMIFEFGFRKSHTPYDHLTLYAWSNLSPTNQKDLFPVGTIVPGSWYHLEATNFKWGGYTNLEIRVNGSDPKFLPFKSTGIATNIKAGVGFFKDDYNASGSFQFDDVTLGIHGVKIADRPIVPIEVGLEGPPSPESFIGGYDFSDHPDDLGHWIFTRGVPDVNGGLLLSSSSRWSYLGTDYTYDHASDSHVGIFDPPAPAVNESWTMTLSMKVLEPGSMYASISKGDDPAYFLHYWEDVFAGYHVMKITVENINDTFQWSLYFDGGLLKQDNHSEYSDIWRFEIGGHAMTARIFNVQFSWRQCGEGEFAYGDGFSLPLEHNATGLTREDFKVSSLPVDHARLVAFNPISSSDEIIATPSRFGVDDVVHFNFIGKPDVNYTDVRVTGASSPLFQFSELPLMTNWTVSKETTIIDTSIPEFVLRSDSIFEETFNHSYLAPWQVAKDEVREHVMINEIKFRGYPDDREWLELKNFAKDVNLEGWTLRKHLPDNSTTIFTFPNWTIVNDGYMVIDDHVYKDQWDGYSPAGYYPSMPDHPYSFGMNFLSPVPPTSLYDFAISLHDPFGKCIDYVEFDNDPEHDFDNRPQGYQWINDSSLQAYTSLTIYRTTFEDNNSASEWSEGADDAVTFSVRNKDVVPRRYVDNDIEIGKWKYAGFLERQLQDCLQVRSFGEFEMRAPFLNSHPEYISAVISPGAETHSVLSFQDNGTPVIQVEFRGVQFENFTEYHAPSYSYTTSGYVSDLGEIMIQGIPTNYSFDIDYIMDNPLEVVLDNINWVDHTFDFHVDGHFLVTNVPFNGSSLNEVRFSTINDTLPQKGMGGTPGEGAIRDYSTIHPRPDGGYDYWIYDTGLTNIYNIYIGDPPSTFIRKREMIIEYEKGGYGFGVLSDDDDHSFFLQPAPAENITLHRFNSSTGAWESRVETCNMSSTAILQIALHNGTIMNWQALPLGHGGIFQFDVNTTDKEGNAYLQPGQYPAWITFQGNDQYEGSVFNFTISVNHAKTRLSYVPDDQVSRDQTDITYWEESREYNNSVFTDEIGEPWTYIEATRNYGDPASFSFELETYDGIPAAGVPIWCQISIVPESMDMGDDFFAESYADYLALQMNDTYIPPQYNHPYIQGKYDVPIVYPFYNVSTFAWEHWGPLVWVYNYTDAEGRITFDFDEIPIREIVGDIATTLKQTPQSLDQISLYFRAFYSDTFSWDGMELPLVEGGRLVSFVNESIVDNYVDGDTYWNPVEFDIYQNDFYESAYCEGKLLIDPEQLILAGGAMEVTPVDDKFYISMMAMEADASPAGTLLPEGGQDLEGWYSDLDTYPVVVQLEIWDHSGERALVNHSGLFNYTDEDGVVTIEVSPSIVGDEQFNKLWPGFYTGKAITGDSMYYDTASSEFEIFIKNPATFDLSSPSFIYDFHDMFEANGIAFTTDGTGMTPGEYEINAPVLHGQVMVENISPVLPNNHSANPDIEDPGIDGIEFSVYFNDFEMDSYEFIMPDECNVSTAYNFSLPLTFFAGREFNLSFGITSLNNATSKQVVISELYVTDSGVRTDRDKWDLLSELPVNHPYLGNVTAGDCNEGPGGSFTMHFDGGADLLHDDYVLFIDAYGTSETHKPCVNVTDSNAIEVYHYDYGEDYPYSTYLSIDGLFTNISRKKLDATHYPGSISANETLYDGWQFAGNVPNSVRLAQLVLGNDTYNSICIGQGGSNSTVLAFPGTYFAHRAEITGALGMAPAPDGTAVNVTFEFNSTSEPDLNKAWDTTLQTATNGTLVNFTIPEAFLSSLAGKSIDVYMKVSLESGNSTEGKVHLIDTVMTGWETVVTVSNNMPEPLRARVFSTTFLYYYARNATDTMGVMRNDDTGEPNDFRMALTGGITDWLNVRDYSIPFEQESYEWKNWTKIKNLFREGSGGCDETWYELDNSTNDTVLAWFKFSEAQKETVVEPRIVSGLLDIYDNDSSTPMHGLQRKITAIIMPWEWNRTQLSYRLNPGSSISTTIDPAISMNENQSDDVLESITMAYRLPAIDGKDLVFDDFSSIVEVIDEPVLANGSLHPDLVAAGLDLDDTHLFDEYCLKPATEAYNVTNQTRFGSILPPTEVTTMPDAFGNSGSLIIETREGCPDPMVQIDNPWRLDGKDWTDYTNFGYELATTNDTSNINGINAILHVKDHSDGGIVKFMIFDNNFTGSAGDLLQARHDLTTATLWTLQEYLDYHVHGNGSIPNATLDDDQDNIIDITFWIDLVNNTKYNLDNKVYQFALGGFYFEHECNNATITATIRDPVTQQVSTVSREIPSTIMSREWFNTWTWDSQFYLNGNLEGISIATNAHSTMDVQSVSVEHRNKTSSQVLSAIYTHLFNDDGWNIANLSYALGTPGALKPTDKWITSENVNTSHVDEWILDQAWDFDFDGEMDLMVRLIDTEMDSNLTDGLNDLLCIDANANGAFELQSFQTITSNVHKTSEGTWCFERIKISSKLFIDEDENGVVDETMEDWMAITSETIPATDYTWYNDSTGTDFKYSRHEFDYSDSEWQFGYEDTVDIDQDGLPDFVRKARDDFADMEQFGLRTYETKTDITWFWDYNNETES